MTEETNYNAKQCKYEKLSFQNFSVHKNAATIVCVCAANMIINYNLSVEHSNLFTANNAIKMTFYRANEKPMEHANDVHRSTKKKLELLQVQHCAFIIHFANK